MTRFGWAIVVALAVFAGYAIGEGRSPSGESARVDTVRVSPAGYEEAKERAAVAEGQVTGLRARIRGLEERRPTTVILTDSVVLTDTVFVAIDRTGRLTYQFAYPTGTPGAGMTQPTGAAELRTGIDVADCDGGLQIRDRQVVCDKPRLGHLSVGPVLARRPALAAWWVPSYRSPWLAEVSFDGERWNFGLRRGVRLW